MKSDGIHSMVAYEDMAPYVQKTRDFYNMKPGAGIIQSEFGFYSMDTWIEQGYVKKNMTRAERRELFGFDLSGSFSLGGLGWTTAEYVPGFQEEILESSEKYEIVRDEAGRAVKYFKNRRSGFMPEYMDHPVKDQKTWEENCKWRLDPNSPERYINFDRTIEQAKIAAGEGKVISHGMIGGFMYLRSLMGPMGLLYMFYDNPGLIHDCMQTWLNLADHVIARYQEHITLDELCLSEDICYNHGSLISKDMIKEFLFPYYQQLITNIRRRQLDPNRPLTVMVDTDGFSDDICKLYQKGIGMRFLSPFEVAAGCDVVRAGKEFPDLLIAGGFDKRILAESKDAIDREIERIMPVMKARGGYHPTCDHGVPAEVSFENYMHYRKRMLEFAD